MNQRFLKKENATCVSPMIQIYDCPFSLDACILLSLYHTLSKSLRNIFSAASAFFPCCSSPAGASFIFLIKNFPFPLAYIFVKLYYYCNPICTRFCIFAIFHEDLLNFIYFSLFYLNKYSYIYKNAN